MERSRFTAAMCVFLFVASNGLAQTPQKEGGLQTSLDLVDGSRLIGHCRIPSVPLQMPFAEVDIPTEQVVRIDLGRNERTASARLRNGDRLSGVLGLKSVELTAIFGEISVKIEHVRTISIYRIVDQLLIEALIDGDTKLHVTRNGLYWENGEWKKVGRGGDVAEPTWVNGEPWMPKWRSSDQDGGYDRSELPPVTLSGPLDDYDFELVAVGPERDAWDIEKRSPVTTRRTTDEIILEFPDREPGGKWYRFELSR